MTQSVKVFFKILMGPLQKFKLSFKRPMHPSTKKTAWQPSRI